MKQLKSKERKNILLQLKEKFDCDIDSFKEYAFLLNENKSKLYLTTKDVADLDLSTLKIDTIGLYFGQLMSGDDLRLSIEGSQLVGKTATKGIITLTDEEFSLWITGEDIIKETEQTGFSIIKHNEDFIGCGKPVLDERTNQTTIHNYIPKSRYVKG